MALRAVLSPAAVVYGLAARSRNFIYDRGWRRGARVAIPVISVGNLTVGGTGKTPVVVWLAEEIEGRGYSLAVLSRGYGRRSRGVHVAASGGKPLLEVNEAGDEPAMIGRRLRGMVIVGERRAAAARTAVDSGANVVLLDDGFQHRALARDFDLLLLDRDRPFANGRMLPSGPLREPRRGAGRAHALMVVDRRPLRAEQSPSPEPVAAMMYGRPCFHARLVPRALVFPDGERWAEAPIGELGGQRILAVSGVADAKAFYEMLHHWEGHIVGVLEYPDHHRYDLDDFRAIRKAARGTDLIVTTEKDLVKLERFPFARGGLVAVRLGVDVDHGDTLLQSIFTAVQGGQAS